MPGRHSGENRPEKNRQRDGQPMPDDELVRLNKALADAGLCSRRKADELIAGGAVSVNGQVMREPGLRVTVRGPGADKIAVHGTPLPAPGRRVWLMMHKPVQVVSTAHDPQGRPTVLDILPKTWKNLRLYPVGRLDYFSEGLVLLTNDGDLARTILHPSGHVPKVYHVLLREALPKEALNAMRSGMRLAEGEELAPVTVRTLPSRDIPAHFPRRGTLVEMTLIQGVNRQIRRMCRDLNLTVLRLSRVRQGPIELGDLAPGTARELTPEEIEALREASRLST